MPEVTQPYKEVSRRELLGMAVPLGIVTIDRAACTACGLCAQDCPTEALTLEYGKETCRLTFKHDHCAACRRCAEICPENCLRVERKMEPERFGIATVLFEDKIVKCSDCGKPIASRSMVEKVRARLSGRTTAVKLEFCPECKSKALLNDAGIG